MINRCSRYPILLAVSSAEVVCPTSMTKRDNVEFSSGPPSVIVLE
jgi:hypothetical protein